MKMHDFSIWAIQKVRYGFIEKMKIDHNINILPLTEKMLTLLIA